VLAEHIEIAIGKHDDVSKAIRQAMWIPSYRETT
jgi:hypothetical protein